MEKCGYFFNYSVWYTVPKKTMDRSIPHVRDIFAPYRASSTPSKGPEMHVYEHSPGSRRRRLDAFQEYMDADRTPSEDTRRPEAKENNNRRNNRSNTQNERPLTEKERNAANRSQEKNNYSSKTLTDRDIRHLERHLSMKKTIRKQISRNLAQAFVEDPKQVLESEGSPAVTTPTPAPQQQRTNDNYTFTLTRAKMARSDTPAFLDMLKDGNQTSEADSGHSSPSHHQDEDEVELDKIIVNRNQVSSTNKSERSGVVANDPKRPSNSFWKKLGFKGKSKR